MMKKKAIGIMGAVSFVVFFLGGAIAQHGGHGHGQSAPSAAKDKMPMAEKSKNAQSQIVEGLKISFEAMAMKEHMKHSSMGGSHGQAEHAKSHMIMVNLQDTASKEIISDAKLKFVVQSPSGKKETGSLVWSGDHYGAGLNLQEKGAFKVQLMIESGGMEREAEFQYKNP